VQKSITLDDRERATACFKMHVFGVRRKKKNEDTRTQSATKM